MSGRGREQCSRDISTQGQERRNCGVHSDQVPDQVRSWPRGISDNEMKHGNEHEGFNWEILLNVINYLLCGDGGCIQVFLLLRCLSAVSSWKRRKSGDTESTGFREEATWCV